MSEVNLDCSSYLDPLKNMMNDYSYHVDSSPRVHIPLITNEMCFFILEKQMFNLPVGKSYWIDTRKGHTALNGSNPRRQPDFKRWHLVGMTDEIL